MDLGRTYRDRLWYTYDFGDDWEHDITIEARFAPDDAKRRLAAVVAR